MSNDIIVETVYRASEKLLKRYGGLEGWFKHLQSMDRRRLQKTKRPRKTKSRQ